MSPQVVFGHMFEKVKNTKGGNLGRQKLAIHHALEVYKPRKLRPYLSNPENNRTLHEAIREKLQRVHDSG